MKVIVGIMVLMGLSCCSSFSTQQAYSIIQENQRLQCQKLPAAEYEDCIKRNDRSYDEYQRIRQEETTSSNTGRN